MSILYTILTIFIITALVPLLLLLRRGFNRVDWVDFYSLGKDAVRVPDLFW